MRRFKALTRPLGAFVLAQAGTSAGLAVAVAAVTALAAAVDGHAPEPGALLRSSLPAAGLGGLAFTLARWRRERADVALAALGLRPMGIVCAGAFLAGAMCMPRPERPSMPPDSTLEITPTLVLAQVDGRTLSVDFTTALPRRSDLGRAWPALPAPTGEAFATPARSAPAALWWLLAGVLAWALARGQGPSLGRTLATLGGVVAGAWVLGL